MRRLFNDLIKQRKRSRTRNTTALAAACIVVFVTTYSLILPAITVDMRSAMDMPGMYMDNEGNPNEGAPQETQEIFGEQAPGLSYEEVYDANVTPEDNTVPDPAVTVDNNTVQDPAVQEGGLPQDGGNIPDNTAAASVAGETPAAQGEGTQTDPEAGNTGETALPGADVPEAETEDPKINEQTEDPGIDEQKEDTEVHEQTADGPGYHITASYTSAANIPEGAVLTVTEITEGMEGYDQYLADASAKLTAGSENESVKYARFFDISFVVTETDEEGSETTYTVEPDASVNVQITLTDKETVNAAPAFEPERMLKKANAADTAGLRNTADAAPADGSVDTTSQLNVLHFTEEAQDPVIVDAQIITEEDRSKVIFDTDSFSIYAIVETYTVDFHYEINGKTVEFSIPGGGFVSLEHVVEVRGIASANENGESRAENATENYNDFTGEVPGVDESGENGEGSADETANVASGSSSASSTVYEQAVNLNNIPVSEAAKRFVADVASVEFSSPELVWVGKVDSAATVGGLKEANGLEIEYSADLTEEQIAGINAQTVEAGDWAFISVHPFTSEESLMVTMRNGDRFEIMVTDAQIRRTVISASGVAYEITVTYDDSAEIPEGSELKVSEILPEDEQYSDYYDKAVKAVRKSNDTEQADTLTSNETPDSFARFFDISIIHGGEAVEPKTPVNVDIKILYAQAASDAWKVVHFETEGPAVMEAEKVETDETDAVEMVFDTDGFSVYAVITVPTAQADPAVTDLDGRSFSISHDNRYATTTITPIENNNTTSGFGKTNSSSQAATWYFERPEGSSGNRYYVYTLVNDQKQYINLTQNNGNTQRANASLSGNPQEFTVTYDNGTYRLAAQSNGTTYYLDEHNGGNGNAFAGWYGQSDNGRLSLNFPTQPVMQDNGKYIILMKYDGKYYIVNNDGTLTEVNYDETTKTAEVEDPMMWTVEKNNPNGHIYFNSTETGFTDLQLASDWYRRYMDPSREGAYLEETNGTGDGHVDIDQPSWHYKEGAGWYAEHHITNRTNVLNTTSVSIDNNGTSGSEVYKIYHGSSSDSNYMGVVVEADGSLRLEGGKSAADAAEFVFASPTGVKDVAWQNHTVDHIDISIAGTANVGVPLAYGKYYGSTAGDAEDPILTVDDNVIIELSEAQMVDPTQLRITAEDMKRATITATRLDNSDTVDDAFYITGYSGNVANGTSNDQVRIEGSFLVADLRGTEYEQVNTDSYNNNWWGYKDRVNAARLENIVEYTVTVVKPLTYYLVNSDGHQLYDAEGKAITVTVDVAFSASFNYWDSKNECPAVNWATGFGGTAWTSGGVDPSNISGMDFVLGGNADDPSSPLVALEITKVIMDEHGNRIELKTPVTNYFDIYEKKNATNDQKNGVAGLHVVDNINHPEWQADPRDATIHNGYEYWRTKRVTVDETGTAIVFDFDATDAMYYIQEKHDAESLPQTVFDKHDNEWAYVKTYIETEYVRRDDDAGTHDEYSNRTLHPGAMHITDEYTMNSTGEYAYASIPEVAGKFIKLNGEQKKEGFLEFYVYNIYTPIQGDIGVHKQWQNANGQQDEWLADVTFKLRKKTVTVSGEGEEQTQTVTYSDVAKPEYMGDDWSDTITVSSPTDEAKWEGLPVLGENESYVVIEHEIIGREGTTVSEIRRDQASGAIISFKLTKDEQTYFYDVIGSQLGNEGGTTINKQLKETDIILKKVDKDDLDETDPDLLKGASFTLSKFESDSFQSKDVSWGTQGSKTLSDNKKPDGTYTLNGSFTFNGLTAGYYKIEEIHFPDGYVKLSSDPTFKIEENASNELIISLINNPDNLLRLVDGEMIIKVGNTPGVALPNTGGPGTRLFTILGSILILGAGVLFVRRRRRI